jgi:hypothetical protein
MVPAPSNFGNARLRSVDRDRCRDAGVDQTGGSGALRRRSNQHHSADSEKDEQFFHGDSPLSTIDDANTERAAWCGGSDTRHTIPAMSLVAPKTLVGVT